jgi:hypothetical protein
VDRESTLRRRQKRGTFGPLFFCQPWSIVSGAGDGLIDLQPAVEVAHGFIERAFYG